MGFYEMHTEEMQKYRYLDSANTLICSMNWMKLLKKLPKPKPSQKKSFLYSQIKEIVENCYDIGKIEEIYEIFGGYVNHQFRSLYSKRRRKDKPGSSANICAIKT